MHAPALERARDLLAALVDAYARPILMVPPAVGVMVTVAPAA